MKTRCWFTCLILVLGSNAHAADWAGWRGPERDGKSSETGLLKTWPAEGPQVLWEAPLGIGYSSVAVVDGRVVTMSQDDSGQYVVAFNAENGEPLWNALTSPPFSCETRHNGPRSTPLVDGSHIYAIDANGVLVLVQAADGSVAWKKNLLELAGAQNVTWGIAQSPFISGEMLLANPGGQNNSAIIALNRTSGEIIWKSANGPAGYSTPVEFRAGGIDQFVFLTGDALCAVAVEDGKVLWSFPWKTEYGVNAATPIVLDDMVFVSSGYRRGAAVIQVNPQAETPVTKLWESQVLQCHIGTPILTDGVLYGYQDQKLACVDFKTGEAKWKDDSREMPGKAQMTYAEGLYYILGENGSLALARLTPESFEKISQIDLQIGDQCWASPVIANGRLYVRGSGKLLCLNIKDQ